MGLFFVACAAYGALAHAMWQYAVFLTLQGVVFLAFGLNYVDGK
jgi:beta-mannan synthase